MTKPTEKTEPVGGKLDKVAAKKVHDNLIENVRRHEVVEAEVWRSCFEAISGKIWEAFGLPDDKTYIEKYFGRTSMGVKAFRERDRVWRQFKSGVGKLRDVKPEEVDSHTTKLLDKSLTAMGNNATRLGDLSRSTVFGETLRDTEANIRQAHDISEDANDAKEFKKKLDKKFAVANKARSAGTKAGAATRAAAKGKTLSVRLEFPLNNHGVFKTAIETISVSTGARQSYADMKASDLADYVFFLAAAYNKSDDAKAILAGLNHEGRQRIAKAHLVAAHCVIAKQTPSDAVVQRTAAKLLTFIDEDAGAEKAS